MDSVTAGIRNDEIYTDTYDRLTCGKCDRPLKTVDDPSEIGTIRTCPKCNAQWRELR